MKYETKNLSEHMLDQAVAKACGHVFGVISSLGVSRVLIAGVSSSFCPSSDWGQGGPIIEREGIELWKWNGDGGAYWCSHVGGRRIDTADKESFGETPLVAAMRAFVTAKLGAEVDLVG